jgi:hypothetical protein
VIIITGPGRSGTSFLADLYKKLRFDPGGGWQKDIRAGREQKDTVEVNNALCEALQVPFKNPRPPFGSERWDLVGELAEQYGPRIRDIAQNWDVVKDPRFSWTLRVWLEAGAKIDHVIVTLRRVNDVVQSAAFAEMANPEGEQGLNKMRSTTMFRIGSLLSTLGEYDVANTVLWFPDYTKDPKRLYESLVFPKPVKYWRFKRALRRTLNPKDIHFGDEKTSASPSAG